MKEIKSVKDIVCEHLGNPYYNPITQREYEIKLNLQWNDSLTFEQRWDLLSELKQIRKLRD